jgi:transketolase
MDATVIACGVMLSRAVEAARMLAAQGLSIRVVEMHTIKPLDGGLVERCARETGCLVTAEEHSVIGGLGGAVAEHVAESGPYAELLEKYGLSVAGIMEAVHRVLKRKREFAGAMS